MVKHGSNFVRVHICSLVKVNEVISEDKSKKVTSNKLKNEKEIKDTNASDATERTVSVVKDVVKAEAQDENSELPIEISSEAKEEEGEKEEEENNERMQEKETEVIEQPIVEESEVIKKTYFRRKK